MKRLLRLSLIALSLALPTVLYAGGKGPFPKQPQINEAYKALTSAAAQVEKSRHDEPAKHLANATQNLDNAKTHLENATKDKGSARPSAIKLIDSALEEVEASKKDPTHLDKAKELIASAQKKVLEAGENGRR